MAKQKNVWLPVFLLYCIGLTGTWAHEPSVTAIDYTHPAQYLAWPDTLGDRQAILAQSAQLKGRSDLETLRNVLNWMGKNLQCDSHKAYAWHNYDAVTREKAYGGCADQGLVCGVLLKAAGIPAIWVKTMDVDWIWAFKKNRSWTSWSGHVFLEVWVDQKWMLLNPGAKTVYPDYDTKARILPGNRFAYDKGNDPKDMILSLQWEDWKKQTETYFRALDESLLPVDTAGGMDLNPTAYVAGNSPYYQAMSQMAAEAGLTVKISFNSDYDKYLPQARGHVLMVETHQGVPIIPQVTLEKYFPGCLKALPNSDGYVKIEDTKIIFTDFSKPLQVLEKRDPTGLQSRLSP